MCNCFWNTFIIIFDNYRFLLQRMCQYRYIYTHTPPLLSKYSSHYGVSCHNENLLGFFKFWFESCFYLRYPYLLKFFYKKQHIKHMRQLAPIYYVTACPNQINMEINTDTGEFRLVGTFFSQLSQWKKVVQINLNSPYTICDNLSRSPIAIHTLKC